MTYYSHSYLTIHEFSDFCQISRRNLIYYDSIGLLKPRKVGENGYRYYTCDQMEYVFIITTLKTLGVPLADIKGYLEQRTPQSCLELLCAQQKQLAKQLAYLEQVQDMIDHRIASLQTAVSVSPDIEVSVEDWPETPIFQGSRLDMEKSCLNDDTYCRFIKEYHRQSLCDGYLHSLYVEKEQLLARHPSFVAHPYFRLKREDHANASIPAGRYAVAYTNGYYGETDQIYERLFDYIETHRLQIAGDAYEDCLTDEIVHKNPEEYLMRVSICVKQS